MIKPTLTNCRIFPNDEGRSIIANYEGLIELNAQISYLLEEEFEDREVQLHTPTHEGDFCSICLVSKIGSPEIQSAKTTILIITILIIIVALFLIGIGTVLSWIF